MVEPFRVVAPYNNGVIVDAGPDAFVRTNKIQGNITINGEGKFEPVWLQTCRNVYWTGKFEYSGSCGRDGIDITINDLGNGVIQTLIMFATTAGNAGVGFDEEKRNDGWSGKEAGLTSDEVIETLRVGFTVLCSPCGTGPGRQTVIDYDTNTDGIPDVEVVYLHVQPNPALYHTWNDQCSVKGKPRNTQWTNSSTKVDCLVNESTFVGEVVNIGFTNGGSFGTEHLHYTVYVDWDSNSKFQFEVMSIIDPLVGLSMIR